jgi:hypothetical protein
MSAKSRKESASGEGKNEAVGVEGGFKTKERRNQDVWGDKSGWKGTGVLISRRTGRRR